MRVAELIEKLKALDPKLEVVSYCEDEDLLVAGEGFRLFDIVDVSAVDAELTRSGRGRPYFKLGRSPASSRQVVLEITADF